MSKMVEIKEVQRGDVFALPNGSVYEAEGSVIDNAALQARLWCAHPPDAITFDPHTTEFPANQQARLLSGADMQEHAHHEGFVQTVFKHEMDRRNNVMMRLAHVRGQEAADEQQRVDDKARPWWKKLFA